MMQHALDNISNVELVVTLRWLNVVLEPGSDSKVMYLDLTEATRYKSAVRPGPP